MRTYQATPASDETYVLAEGPTWDVESGQLAWVDIPAGEVHVGRLEGDRVETLRTHLVDTYASAIAFAGAGRLLVSGHRSVFLVAEDGSRAAVEQLIEPAASRRLNDGACDPAGRFLVGSLSLGEVPGTESLHRISGQTDPELLDDDLFMSNGIAWSPDGRTLYTIDTTPGIVWSRPYDPVTGEHGPRAELFRITDGSPDGLCVDSAGCLWVAVWGPGEIRAFDTEGTMQAVVDVPAPHTTSAAFVGPHLDRLLITTASDELDGSQLATYPRSGHLFLADVDAAGIPASRWA